jgi:2-desacetyl-2-hydroxyethyl bacteriochlorophyllide A dehydrogenase
MPAQSLIDVLVCDQPGALHIEQRPAPIRSADEVLVRPRRVGICGTDYHIFEGKHPFLQYPRVMGHELAVEVVEAPAGSSLAKEEICVVNPYVACGKCIACRYGKPNCCVRIAVLGVHRDGGMTTLLSLPAKNLIKAPGLSVDACAAVEFLAIGAHAVRRGAASSNDRVLVVGAGPIGLGVALFASNAGASVTTMDLDASRLKAVGTLFNGSVIQGGELALDEVQAQTSGDGYDLVFDATGNAGSMEQSFDFVAHGGRYVLVGVVKSPIRFEDADFHRRELSLHGSRNATSADFEQVMDAIRLGRVPLDQLITHRTSLAGAAEMLPQWAANKTGLIKAMIELDG